MSKWGWAVCREDQEPLISTLEFPGFEFVCVVCGRKYGFLEPHSMPDDTPGMQERYDELKKIYDAERKHRKEAAR